MTNKSSFGIHQWLPGFASGDAISNYTLGLQRIIRSLGYNSEIFCPLRHASPKVKGLCINWEEYSSYSSSNNIVIYHFSIGSPMSEKFKNLPDRKALIYHNITPDKYFRMMDAEKALVLYYGREELQKLNNVSELALADSEYNRIELEEWGYKNTGVLYPLLDFEGLKNRPDKNVINKYKDDWVNILFVGRITPNKKIEDIIKVFFYYRNYINQKSRLFLVGSFLETERYYSYLKGLVLELNLPNVIFTKHVTAQELVSYYSIADIFLCMSEHEGFCIPLVESMYFGIPIIAYAASAVPYTLGGTGVLVDEKDYRSISELIDKVVSDSGIRKKIIEAQSVRFKDFEFHKIEARFKNYLEKLIER
jgi:glycosyltransferase involved in cell wall biosynthesis